MVGNTGEKGLFIGRCVILSFGALSVGGAIYLKYCVHAIVTMAVLFLFTVIRLRDIIALRYWFRNNAPLYDMDEYRNRKFVNALWSLLLTISIALINAGHVDCP